MNGWEVSLLNSIGTLSRLLRCSESELVSGPGTGQVALIPLNTTANQVLHS